MVHRIVKWISAVLILGLVSGCAGQPRIYLNEPTERFDGVTEENIEEDLLPENGPSMFQAEEIHGVDWEQTSISLYFFDERNNRLAPEVRSILTQSEEDVTQQIIKELIRGPETSGFSAVISPDTRLLKIDQAENILTVNVSAEFLNSENVLIARAALVNSLTEMDRFKYVKLYIEGKELTVDGTDSGAILGLLTRFPNSVPEILAADGRLNEKGDIIRVHRELYFQDIQGLYLLPEVRTITIVGRQYVPAIVEELLKGPVLMNEGLYPTLPKGIKLNSAELLKGEQMEDNGIALYFSKEFRTQFTGGSSQEMAMLGSLVYTLTTLPGVGYIKIYYEDEKGEYIDQPIHSIPLHQPLTVEKFPDMLGKRIRVFFGDKQGNLLVPEYRAISRKNMDIAGRIIAELTTNPTNPDSVRVIPESITEGEIKVIIDDEKAFVNMPVRYFQAIDGDTGMIRNLYAIVNSLTDPVNLRNISEVQFLVDGKAVDLYKDISLIEPFVRNPALIKE